MSTAPRRRVTGYPSTSGDDVQLNTTTLIRHAARTHGDREIVYRTADGGWDRYTYADLERRVAALEARLEPENPQPAALALIVAG